MKTSIAENFMRPANASIMSVAVRIAKVIWKITDFPAFLPGLKPRASCGKYCEKVTDEDFRHIRWFKEKQGKKVVGAFVFYCGQQVRDFGDGCIAVPMAAFWN